MSRAAPTLTLRRVGKGGIPSTFAIEHLLQRCQRRLFLSQRDLNKGMKVCWVAEPIPHTEIPPHGSGSPFPWRRFAPQCDANPVGQEPSVCAARAQEAARAALPPPARLIYAAPHFLLVSMPFSLPSLLVFFLFFLIPSPGAACASPRSFIFTIPYCSQASVIPALWSSLLVCVQNGVLSSRRR